MMPVKNPSAASVRSPDGPTTTTRASSATSTVGKSEAGSACAMLPPIVPRLLTAGSPIIPAASASAGAAFCTSADAAISACVVNAPMRIVSPLREMPRNSGMRPMSTTAAGDARRSFMSGIRL
jgi:hypothetical protein